MKKTKISLILSAIAIMTITSCGGAKAENEDKEEKKDLSLCECSKLKDEYPSKEDAEKALGKETVEKCVELFESATDADFEKCK